LDATGAIVVRRFDTLTNKGTQNMRTAVAKRQSTVDMRLPVFTRATARYFPFELRSKAAWKAIGRRLIANARPAARRHSTDGGYELFALDQTEPIESARRPST
jgi:hypothetical protein